MTDTVLRLSCWFVLAALSVLSADAFATAQRTFVASIGKDTDACSLAAPCRSFARAITQTSPGGEVIVLDSAGYGTFTVTKSVKITSPAGIYAGISVFSGEGVTVNGAGINVTLRGLTINSQGGDTGIHFVQGAALTVDRCEISGFAMHGILQDATAVKMVVRASSIAGGAGKGIETASVTVIDHVAIADVGDIGIEVPNGGNVAIRDTSITGAASNGVHAASFGPPTTVTLDGVTIAACVAGIGAFASGASSATYVDVVRSRITQNVFEGAASGAIVPGAIALIHVTDSLISRNGSAGLSTDTLGQITVSGNTIVNNGAYGLDSYNNGIYTMGNNQVRDNGPANTRGTINPLTFN